MNQFADNEFSQYSAAEKLLLANSNGSKKKKLLKGFCHSLVSRQVDSQKI